MHSFIRRSSFLLSDLRMSAGQQAAAPGAHPARAQARGRVNTRARRREDRENSLGLIITTSLFFVLFSAAVLLGGHAIIAPLLHRTHTVRGNMNSTGDIVYTMPDGMFCRHLLFDNTTGDITEGAIEECPGSSGAESSSSEFRWGSGH